MKNYNIFIRSNEHPRNINTPRNGRTYYTHIVVKGREAFEAKVKELVANGEHISEMYADLGRCIYEWEII